MEKADEEERWPAPYTLSTRGRMVAIRPPEPAWRWRGAARSPLGGEPTTISAAQRNLHIVSEAMALVLTVPFFFYAAKRLPTAAERKTAFWMGVGALVVDGFLLLRYVTGTSDKPILPGS